MWLEELAIFDALAIIHPTSNEPNNANYRDNLLTSARFFYALGRPIFLVPDSIKDHEMRRILQQAIPIREDIENEDAVDLISEKIGKDPKDIKLAFGGTSYSACVHAYATAWCCKVDFNFIPEFEPEKPPMRAIAYGKIFKEIT